MRRQGQYADSGVNSYASGQMQHNSGSQMEFQGQLEAFTPERDLPYGNSTTEGQWRWERDGSSASNPMASHMFNEGQKGNASMSYYRAPRTDEKLGLEKHGMTNARPDSHEQDMEVGYEENSSVPTFEGLEYKFLDDIIKLTKEQTDAEDAENARHREKINEINSQYEGQLVALRTRRDSHRDEILRKEANARQQQYQNTMMDQFHNSGMPPNDPHPHRYGEAPPSAAAREAHRPYNNDSYRDRPHYLGSARDHGPESRGPYPPRGHAYDIGSRYN